MCRKCSCSVCNQKAVLDLFTLGMWRVLYYPTKLGLSGSSHRCPKNYRHRYRYR